MTEEVFDRFLQPLVINGVIASFISGWRFDFEPLLRTVADHFGMHAVLLDNDHAESQDGRLWTADFASSQPLLK